MSRARESGHKYSTGTRSTTLAKTTRWQRTHGAPRLSEHAVERYDERTDPESVSPERAWLAGVDGGLVTPHFNGAEAVRWHPETDALFIAENDVVVTVLVLGRISDGAVKSYLAAKAQAEGRL